MFDIGWQELLVLAVLAIVVIGPKDLPRTIRTVTNWVRKARSMVRDLQDGVDDMVREVELEDIKKHANSFLDDELSSAGTITREFDMSEEERNWSKAVNDFEMSTNPDISNEKNVKSQTGPDYENEDRIEQTASQSGFDANKSAKTSGKF